MIDPISRQAAIGEIRKCRFVVDAIEKIRGLPSAQPELIRCKDCKWYEIYQLKKDGTEDRRHRPSYCVILSYKTRPDWFCADGERREDEAD